MFGKAENNIDEVNPQGIGFGLTISQKILEQLNSHINVNTSVGKGSEFYFDLKLEVQ